MTTIAYLPARGGSKRIPGKNIRNFVGVPVLGRTIKIVEDTGVFDRILVSTDDARIASVAEQFGAEVVERPAQLADDHTGLLGVVQGELNQTAYPNAEDDVVACVLPTAVLMAADNLRTAVSRVQELTSSFVVSVGRFSYPIQRALRVLESGEIEMAWPENYFARSQDLEPMFHDAGQFYVGSTAEWLRRKTMFETPTFGLTVNDNRVMDIDTESDWVRAEEMWSVLNSRRPD